MYERFLKPLLFKLDPERAHDLGVFALRLLGGSPSLARSWRASVAPDDPRLSSTRFGLQFPNPVGLAAGFDKNGVALSGLTALGFGFLEAGTVTPRPQPGNDKPRLFRLPEDRALINRLGFNNHGAAALAQSLAAHNEQACMRLPIGINLGKNKITPPEQAAADYAAAARELKASGDYFVINVSSPNTPGLRDLQAPDELAAIVRAVRAEIGAIPLLVKLAPDLTDAALAESMVVSESAGAAGFILTNTTLGRAGLSHKDASQAGGLSGAPLTARALAVLRALRPVTKLPLIGVGGIMTAGDLFDRLSAGADLAQVYTGFIYGGPGWVGGLLDGLSRRLDKLSISSLDGLIGSGVADPGD